jgi:hypothetical protein
MFSYTLDNLMRLLQDRYDTVELVDVLGLDQNELVYHLREYIEDNFEDIHQRVLDDEQDHFGLYYGEENDE